MKGRGGLLESRVYGIYKGANEARQHAVLKSSTASAIKQGNNTRNDDSSKGTSKHRYNSKFEQKPRLLLMGLKRYVTSSC